MEFIPLDVVQKIEETQKTKIAHSKALAEEEFTYIFETFRKIVNDPKFLESIVDDPFHPKVIFPLKNQEIQADKHAFDLLDTQIRSKLKNYSIVERDFVLCWKFKLSNNQIKYYDEEEEPLPVKLVEEKRRYYTLTDKVSKTKESFDRIISENEKLIRDIGKNVKTLPKLKVPPESKYVDNQELVGEPLNPQSWGTPTPKHSLPDPPPEVEPKEVDTTRTIIRPPRPPVGRIPKKIFDTSLPKV